MPLSARLARLAPLVLMGALACEPTSSFDKGPRPQTHGEQRTKWCNPGPTKVDILLVIDDSPSMERLQTSLAQTLSELAEKLDAPYPGHDYRIGITTTSVDDPRCSSPPPPALMDESCLDRLPDFVTPTTPESEGLDETAQCQQSCAREKLDWSDAEGPWLARGGTNHPNASPDGAPLTELLPCLGLVGTSGCRFESPVTAIHRVLDESEDPDAPGFGFLRADAHLLIVVLGNEDDCSLGPDGFAAFDPDGERKLWPPPEGEVPPDGICWRASTHCGGPDGQDPACVTVDRDRNGDIISSGTDTVLRSYRDLAHRLRNLELHDPLAPRYVVMSLVGGVDQDGAISTDFLDTPHTANFGVNVGCLYQERWAQPPLRLAALVDEFSEDPPSPACSEEYGPAFYPLWPSIGPLPAPRCFPSRVRDKDASKPGVQAACHVQVEVGEERFEMSECVRDEEGRYLLEDSDYVVPEGEDYCYILATDEGWEDSHAQLDIECLDHGYNLQFRSKAKRSTPWREHCVELTCEVETE